MRSLKVGRPSSSGLRINDRLPQKVTVISIAYILVWLVQCSSVVVMVSALSASQSPLFRQRSRMQQQQQQHQHRYSPQGQYGDSWSRLFRTRFPSSSRVAPPPGVRSRTSSELNMVVTTPAYLIEEAATKNMIDDLIDESVRTSARRPIIIQFDPSSGRIWRQWKGTVFSETWTSCVKNMAYATIIFFFLKANPGIKDTLKGVNILWGQLLSVTTFTLTFFLNQSYALWRKCSELSRRLQGRLNDLGMTCAGHAVRVNPSSPDEPSTYTSSSRQLLELMGRYVRIFNLFTYASFTTSHRPLLTPRGMRRMMERGILTPLEYDVLTRTDTPATQLHNSVILWVIRLFTEGCDAGHFTGGSGFEQQFMEKVHVIRGQYGAIGDELQGRMPLAYAHIVQVLVDVILWMYPLMAFSIEMTPFLGVLGTGLLTIFYQGLFDLAKQFLDPYDNETYGKGEDPLCVDTLVAETNAGSIRWLNGFAEQPWASQRVKDGELFDYLLPVRGYSVDELDQMEADKLKKEQENSENQKRDEAERVKKKEEQEKEALEEVERTELMRETMEKRLVDFVLNGTAVNGNNLSPLTDNTDDETVRSEEFAIEGESKMHQVTLLEDGTQVSLDSSEQELKEVHKVTSLEDGTPVTLDNLERELHKVTTLEDGTPVTLDSQEQEWKKDEEIQSVSKEALDLEDMHDVDLDIDDTLEDTERELNLVQFFNEVGPDGQALSLSQMLADEQWIDRKETVLLQKENQSQPTLETTRMEGAEERNRESRENISALNEGDAFVDLKGSEQGNFAFTAANLPTAQNAKIGYDQTKVDGISQLWGLPPDDLSSLEAMNDNSTLAMEDFQFEGISQLWGETTSSDSPTSQNTEEAVPTSDFNGVSQLWGNFPWEALEHENPMIPEEQSSSANQGSQPLTQASVYAGVEWFDEVGPDGNEYRLSQMLADEDWEEEIHVAAPISLEDFSKQMAELKEASEAEMRETEAILNAPPGANSVELEEESSSSRVEPAFTARSETSAIAGTAMAAGEKGATFAEQQMETKGDTSFDPLAALEMDSDEPLEVLDMDSILVANGTESRDVDFIPTVQNGVNVSLKLDKDAIAAENTRVGKDEDATLLDSVSGEESTISNEDEDNDR